MAIGLGGGKDTRVKDGAANPEGNVTADTGTLYLETGDYAQAYLKRLTSGSAFNWTGLAGKIYGSAQFYVDSVIGNDANYDGKSWGTPFATIQKAVDTLDASGTIWISGRTYSETVTTANKAIHFKGTGRGTIGGNTVIKAPSAGADCVVNAQGACVFEDITTQGYASQWTGVGWNLSVAYTRLIRCAHGNADADTVNSTYGGTGLRITGTEGLVD